MTITELVVVVGLILALTVASIPLFYHLRKTSRERDARDLVSQMQARMVASHIDHLLGDKNSEQVHQLDSNPAPDECARCFETVLEKGLTSKSWFKQSDTEYLFSVNGGEQKPIDFQKSGNLKMIYVPATGQIKIESIP